MKIQINYKRCSDGTIRIWSEGEEIVGVFHVLTEKEFAELREANPALDLVERDGERHCFVGFVK